MSDRGQYRPRTDDRHEDQPPYSRIFIVCDKRCTESDLRTPFEALGKIENIYIPKNRDTGEPKGVAFIKYAKTSAAAAAIREYHLKVINEEFNRPVRVMLACNRDATDLNINEEKYRRLFIIAQKDETPEQLKDHFSKFGRITGISFQTKKTNEKAFAYVNFTTFHETAIAFEECDKKYKAVFAIPRDELKRNRNSFEGSVENGYMRDFRESFHDPNYRQQLPPERFSSRENISLTARPDKCCKVIAHVQPSVPQKYLEKLFNIIPGLQNFEYTHDAYSGTCRVNVLYTEPKYASFACERLNLFEFPSGETIAVKLDNDPISKAAVDLKNIVDSFKSFIDSGRSPNDLINLADAISEASNLIKAATSATSETPDMTTEPNYCSIKLPPPKPIAETTNTAKRCFVVFKPFPPNPHVMRDVFRRFGDLIDINMLPGKNYGFARFASQSAANEAIRVLNGITVCGNKLKIVEATEQNDNKRLKMDVDNE